MTPHPLSPLTCSPLYSPLYPTYGSAAGMKLEQELEAAEIIQKVDKTTAWTSPGFFIPKPNGGVRLVTDYAGL
jgi:hypothetical protein